MIESIYCQRCGQMVGHIVWSNFWRLPLHKAIYCAECGKTTKQEVKVNANVEPGIAKNKP